jgi:hypothetical protein
MSQLKLLQNSPDKRNICKAVEKTLGYMETNLRHPSLHTHEYSQFRGERVEKVFESYAQNRTPGAYRIFWHYGPGESIISVVSIIPHP